MSSSKLEFKDSTYLDTAFPASERIYIQGQVHPSVRVPLREVSTKDGMRTRVYDTRGPWGDPGYRGNCSGHIYRQIFEFLRPRVFTDPMVGSGTSVEVARDMGVPAVCYGPQPTLSAGIDDYAEEKDVLDCAKVYARTALALLG